MSTQSAPIRVGPEIIEPGWIGLVPQGLTAPLGCEPLGEPITMWWNFVARTRQEIDDAYRDWGQRTDGFGDVESELDRIDAPRPPWMRAAE